MKQAEDELKRAQLEVQKNEIVSRIDAEKNQEALDEEVFVGALLIQKVFRLGLRIEFDEKVALNHVGAGGSQLGDDHGADLSPLEPGRQNHKGTRSFGGPI